MNWQATGYSQGDMIRMQEDAIRRVRQMQKRAQTLTEGGAAPLQQAPPALNAPAPAAMAPSREKRHANGQKPSGHGTPTPREKANPLFSLNLDDDRLLILALLLVMINEQADMTLILALFYLLL